MSFRYSEYFKNISTHFPEATFEDIKERSHELFCCAVKSYGNGDFGEHYHEYLELIYVVAASMTVRVNSHDYHMNSGDFLVVIPGDVHSMTCNKGCKYVVLQADTDFVFSSVLSNSELHYVMPYTLSIHNEARLFKANIVDSTEIPKCIYNIVSEYTDRNKFFTLAIRCHLSAIALYAFRHWDKILSESNEERHDMTEEDPRLSRVIEVINERYADDLSAEEMAQIAGMSYSYFSRYFKSTVGLSYSEYLNAVRIKASEKLLIDSNLSVADIAAAVGFSNTSYYIAQFKKQLHMTPKRYKNSFSGVVGQSDN